MSKNLFFCFWRLVSSQQVQWSALTEKMMLMRTCIQNITGSLQTTSKAQTWTLQSPSASGASRRFSVTGVATENLISQRSSCGSTSSTGKDFTLLVFFLEFCDDSSECNFSFFLPPYLPGLRTLTKVLKPVTTQTSISCTGAMKKWQWACLRCSVGVRLNTEKTWMNPSRIIPVVDLTASIFWRYDFDYWE